jgi:hypothetical protein
MTLKHTLVPKLCLVLACLALLLGAPRGVRAQASTPQAKSALDLATTWIYALKRSETRVLDNTSAYPFELRIQNAPCRCEGGKARDKAELAELLRELMKSGDVKALEVTSADAKEVFKERLPEWAKRWSKRLPKGTRLVQVESSGGVYTITYVLVIKNDQVQALWLNAASDGGA